jgi:hypothetical protein
MFQFSSRREPFELASYTYAAASSRFSIGARKTGFEERQAAMVKMGSRHWKTVARISICEAQVLKLAIQPNPSDSPSQDEGQEEA